VFFGYNFTPMLILVIFLLTLEFLTFLVLKEHFLVRSKTRFYVFLTINTLLSLLFWYVLLRSITFRGSFDTPSNIVFHMYLAWMISSVIVPRFILIFLHYAGRLIRIREKKHSRVLTNTGITISVIFLCVMVLSSTAGRFNIRTEEVTVNIKGLDSRLEGLRIVQLSDMHLSSFYNHRRLMERVIIKVNSLKPDLLINTGDFVSYGWREFARFDTIFSKSVSRYGNYAVLGNHDMGTYLPNSTSEEKSDNIRKMKELITASGYRLLDNEHIFLEINGARVELLGVETSGRYPEMIHTDVRLAMNGTDTADLRIMLLHDPNQWKKDIVGKTDIELSFAGHTHGMQIGILTKKFRWSPAKYIYPEWNGLFTTGNQYLYVNRGLGVLGIPFRLWMPPEITVLTLSAG
jgi:uncharacterized protein